MKALAEYSNDPQVGSSTSDGKGSQLLYVRYPEE